MREKALGRQLSGNRWIYDQTRLSYPSYKNGNHGSNTSIFNVTHVGLMKMVIHVA